MSDAPRSRFAFLIHPRTDVAADLATINPLLGLVPNAAYEWALARLPLRPTIQATVRAADRPAEVLGDVITLPITPAQLLGKDRKFVDRSIDAAVDLAVRRGATIVGLGALTAPATGGGNRLRKRTDIGVTNGNAFTAAATAAAIARVAAAMPQRPRIVLVGATGSVGTAVARVLARDGVARELRLIARTERHLHALAAELRPLTADPVTTATGMEGCRNAELIVLMTSATDALLGSAHLDRNAVVIDDTQPRNTAESLLAERPDVTIIDGGIVETAGLLRTGRSIGLPADRSFACLAETALLALAGHAGHAVIGKPTAAWVDRMAETAGRFAHLGFGVAEPTSFGRPLNLPGWHAPVSDVLDDAREDAAVEA